MVAPRLEALLIINKEYSAKNVPVIVIGIPEKTPSKSVILYFANLYAPATGKTKTIKYPKDPSKAKL